MLPLIKREWQRARSALWTRPTLYCLLAVITAGLVWWVDPYLPEERFGWLYRVQTEDVKQLLQLVASGMLTVVTVTMSVMMLVLSLVAGQASPRAVPELMADRVIQNALGVFLASFVFALTASGMLALELVSGAGMSLLAAIALLLLIAALVSLLRLIQRGASVMKLNEVVARLYTQADQVLRTYLGGGGDSPRETAPEWPGDGLEVHPRSTGYVQLLDESTLVSACREHDVRVHMQVREGDFVHPSTVLMQVQGLNEDDADTCDALRGCVVIGSERSLEEDPLLGFAMLAEVASRAISPGINDPQTAIICIDRLSALLTRAAQVAQQDYPPAVIGEGRVRVRRPDFGDMLERGLRPLMRDSANLAEVQQRLAEVLLELSELAQPAYLDLLATESERLLAFAEQGLRYPPDLETVRATLAPLGRQGQESPG